MPVVSLPTRFAGFAILLVTALALLTTCGDGGAVIDPTPTVDLSTERVTTATTLSTVYYDVYGATTDAIFSYIEQNGPTDGEGKRGSGLTSVVWGYEWQGGAANDQCAIRSMTIRADMTVTLPRHAAIAQLSESTLRHWNRYAEGVAGHEQTHVDIYEDGAENLKKLMQTLPPQVSCEELEVQIGRTWAAEQTRINQRQTDFHSIEAERLAAAREPIEAQIEKNRADLNSLQVQIDQLDQTLRSLRGQIDALAGRIDDLYAEINRVEQSNLPTPEKQAQLARLTQQRNDQIAYHNQLVEQHNSTLRRRGQLAGQYGTLLTTTNQLVEDFNWAR